MKHLRIMLILLVSLAGIQYSYGVIQEDPIAVDNYYFGCTPEDKDAFDQLWTVLKLDNDDTVRTWAFKGYLYCISNLDIESNDFLITPKIYLTEGKSHFLKMKLGAPGAGQRVVFTIGKDKTAEAQDIVLLDSTFNRVTGYLTLKLPENISGECYLGFNYKGEPWSGQFFLYSVLLTENEGVDLKGTVTNNKGQVLAGAKVSLSGQKYNEMIIDTDKDGKYSFNSLDPGEYKLQITIDGHTTHEETITIGTTAIDHPVVMAAFMEFDVKGCVKSEEGAPVKSAMVTLKGERSYNTQTDEEGCFLIEKAREYKGYELKIEKDLKMTYRDTIDVNSSEIDLGEIVMKTRVSHPYKVVAQEVEEGAILSWMLPLKMGEARYDSGIHFGSYSMADGTEFSVIGVAFDAPILVNGISWMANTDDELIDLYVFDINKDGSLSNRILYSAKGVKNISNKFVWNEYRFPEEIVAPYGCAVALSGKNLSVMMDSGNDEGYPKAYKNLGSGDYRNGLSFIRDIIGNLFVRLLASPLGIPQLAPGMNVKAIDYFRSTSASTMFKALATGEVTYRAWRFEVKEKENQDQWTPLEITDQKSLSYLDRSYNQLPIGVYQYAVQVEYADGQESAIGYSNELEHKVYAKAMFNITTNVGTSYADGAEAALIEEDGEVPAYTTIVKEGLAAFEHIKKGNYYLKISQKGFEEKETGLLNLLSDNNYLSEAYTLKLINRSPFNLSIEQKDMDVILGWNVEEGIFENFEGMDDFAVNPEGELEWSFVDGDKSVTAGVAMCQNTPYPNMSAKMAYMSFNPSKTTPDLLEFLKPYSGDKVLVSVMAEEAKNDDYLFSPELSFENDFALSFYAKSGFFAVGGDEEFMVGYCLESATPENVTWLTNEPQRVGAAWKEFEYDIPANAKYITIRNVSDRKFFFVLDDIYIGYKSSLVHELANYDVYLDDEYLGKTNHFEMTFSNLSAGKHKAKVQAIYALTDGSKVYSDFVEQIFTVKDNSGIKGHTQEKRYTYEPSGMITFDSATDVMVYNVQGQLVEMSKTGRVNMRDWESGIYLFRVKANHTISHYKISVE